MARRGNAFIRVPLGLLISHSALHYVECRAALNLIWFRAHLRYSLPAIRTIPEPRRDRLAALGAGLGGTELDGAHLGMPGFIEDPAAPAALQESLPPLNRNQGDEKKADVMVQAPKPG